MQSARDHPEVLSQYLAEEVAAGQVLGPLPEECVPTSGWHVSLFGVIPKPHKPNKWQLIVDLSYPAGASVNDGISPALCSLRYTRVEEFAAVVLQLGRGMELAKADIKAAYRIVPVHPDDRHLLVMRWQGGIYADTALPFGLRSAQKLFNAVADALEWCTKDAGAEFLWHYLDNCSMQPPWLGRAVLLSEGFTTCYRRTIMSGSIRRHGRIWPGGRLSSSLGTGCPY